MNTEIIFEKARITAVEHRITAGTVTSRLKVVAIATAKIARAIGARWLLDKDALVKQGFSSVELDYALKNVRLKHGIEKVANLELVSEMVTKFKVFRKGDDAKKAKKLMVSFQAHHTGSPFELLEHLMKVGEGEGTCTLIGLQAEMFPENAAEPKPKSRGRQIEIPSAPKKSAPKKDHPLPPDQANAHGVFATAKPVQQYKGGEKCFNAVLFVVEVEFGYVAGYGVQAGHAARAAMPSKDGPYYGTEADALQAAARVVVELAGNVARTGIRSHKREAAKMVAWAETFILPEDDHDVHQVPLEDPVPAKTGKEAAYPD